MKVHEFDREEADLENGSEAMEKLIMGQMLEKTQAQEGMEMAERNKRMGV